MTQPRPLPIAITPGDPCGIGPEILAKAWLQEPHLTRGCFVAGDVGVMRRAAALVAAPVSLPVCEITTAAQAWLVPPRCVPVLQVVGGVGRAVTGAVSVLQWVASQVALVGTRRRCEGRRHR